MLRLAVEIALVRFWVDGRQLFPYRIMEGLPVIVAE